MPVILMWYQVGPESLWKTPPFEATVIDGYLHGRGAADMKGSLAAMLLATKNFVQKNPEHKGSIAFLITSDEEGPFINGTTRVVDNPGSEKRKNHLVYCWRNPPVQNKLVTW